VNRRIAERKGNLCDHAAPMAPSVARARRDGVRSRYLPMKNGIPSAVMGKPDLVKDQVRNDSRQKENEAELERLVGEWTVHFTRKNDDSSRGWRPAGSLKMVRI